MHTEIQGKKFPVKQTGKRFSYWSSRAGRWLPVAKSKVIVDEAGFEARVAAMEAQGMTRSDAQGVIEAQEMIQTPKPWVVVRNPGQDDQIEIDSFVVPTLAQACMRANPGSDLMRRQANGQLTTEF